ncbi:MAG: HAMP domain-containing sensor histidine kinase [Acidimicrobiia bacterium]|jgi:signal transduction histidine kinase
MGKAAVGDSTTGRRTVALAIGAALVVLVLVAGLAFVNSISVSRVTENARSLHWTNATLGTSALTRAGLAQAVTFAELEETDVVSQADLQFAMEQLTGSQADLEALFEMGEGHESYGPLNRYVASVAAAVSALETGDVDTAKELTKTDVENSYVDLANALFAEQTEIQAAIEDHNASGNALNGWVVFILTLLVPGAAVAVYFVIARRQVKATKERAQLEVEAERTISRAKDSFIAGLSHELRTPLTSIYGFAEVLTDGDVQGPEATRETAQIIANEAAEMTRMVDDLLAASRLESTGIEIDKASTRLTDVIESAIAPFERAGLTVRREASLIVVDTDAARLRHVLVNLLSNAARHGGPDVSVEVTSGESAVDVEVCDNGPGVSEEKVPHLFDRFAHDGSAPLLTGSIGLGLAVASRLTDLIGGQLQYQRFAGKTYFTVTLPLKEVDVSEDDEDSNSIASMIRALSA